MTVAYCIAAHTRPSQCRRLVLRLLEDDPGCLVFLHYDQRESPLDLREVTGPRVRVLSQRPVFWGSTHLVDLFVEMFEEAVGTGCAYVVMLSGQDYPLVHLGDFENELSGYDVWADINATVRAGRVVQLARGQTSLLVPVVAHRQTAPSIEGH